MHCKHLILIEDQILKKKPSQIVIPVVLSCLVSALIFSTWVIILFYWRFGYHGHRYSKHYNIFEVYTPGEISYQAIKWTSDNNILDITPMNGNINK